MKITFPHLGNTYIIVKAILDDLGVEYVIPPFNNKRALELGARYAPEMVCLPLKINIGNLIQAYEMGADTILMAGGCGPCRFGYYSQLEREILRDAGYDMEMITLDATSTGLAGIREIREKVMSIVPKGTSLNKLLFVLGRAVKLAKRIDRLEMLTFKIRARELERGSVDRVYGRFRENALKKSGSDELAALLKETEDMLGNVAMDDNANVLRVGIVGEIYTGIEHSASFRIQERLGSMGVEADRKVTVSNWIIEHMIKKGLHLPRDLRYQEAAKPWLGAMIGGHAQETIGHTAMYARKGYDGVIQIFPFSCMPEIVAESLIPSVERDMGIPVLTLIIDEMTGEAGYMTRVEAFIDMLEKRREQKKYERTRLFSWS